MIRSLLPKGLASLPRNVPGNQCNQREIPRIGEAMSPQTAVANRPCRSQSPLHAWQPRAKTASHICTRYGSKTQTKCQVRFGQVAIERQQGLGRHRTNGSVNFNHGNMRCSLPAIDRNPHPGSKMLSLMARLVELSSSRPASLV